MDDHTHIGHTSHGKPVSLTLEERLRHMAIFGSTGVGKTTFLLNIAAQDIARGDGLLVMDPHGGSPSARSRSCRLPATTRSAISISLIAPCRLQRPRRRHA